jgi:hypothetical protein
MGYMNMRHWYQEDCNKNMEFMNMRHQKLKIIKKNIYAKMSRKNTIVKMSSRIKSLGLSKVGRYDNHKKQYNSL